MVYKQFLYIHILSDQRGVSFKRPFVLFQFAFKRHLRWLRRQLFNIRITMPASLPPCRLGVILNAKWNQYTSSMDPVLPAGQKMKKTLDVAERDFFSLVNQAILANPFGDRRAAIDLRIAEQFAKPSRQAPVDRAVQEVSRRIRRLEKNGFGCIERFAPEDRELMRRFFFIRCLPPVRRTIRRAYPEPACGRRRSAARRICRSGVGSLSAAGGLPQPKPCAILPCASRCAGLFFSSTRACWAIALPCGICGANYGTTFSPTIWPCMTATCGTAWKTFPP